MMERLFRLGWFVARMFLAAATTTFIMCLVIVLLDDVIALRDTSGNDPVTTLFVKWAPSLFVVGGVVASLSVGTWIGGWEMRWPLIKAVFNFHRPAPPQPQ